MTKYKVSERNLLWWPVVSAISFAAASTLSYFFFTQNFSEDPRLVLLIPTGIILGTVQWLVIERFLPRLWLWVPATIPAGYIIVFAVYGLRGNPFHGMNLVPFFLVVLFAPLTGLVVGVTQYFALLLRIGKEKAELRWVLLSLFAWPAGFWVAMIIGEWVAPLVGGGFLLVITTMTTGGLVVGLITMLGWRRLLPALLDRHMESRELQAQAAAVRRRLILLFSLAIVVVLAIGSLPKVLEQTILAPVSVACEEELVTVYRSGKRDFSNICLRDSDLSGSHLAGILLAGADIQNTSLAGANLSKANLSGARLDYVNLMSTNFAGANLTDAVISNSSIQGAKFNGADMRWSVWNFDMTGVNLSGANLSGANLITGRLYGANWHGTIIDENTAMGQTYKLVWDIVNEGGAGRDLSAAKLGYADLRHADLRGADLTGAHLTEANLTGADLAGADLTGADLTRANFTAAVVTSEQLEQAVSLRETILPDGTVPDG